MVKVVLFKKCDFTLLSYIMTLKLRPEMFWYTLYDWNTLNHTYVSKEIGDVLLSKSEAHLVKSRYSWEINNILVAPVRVYFEATVKCNLRCTHCFNSSWKENKWQLPSSEVIRILEWFKQDWVMDVRFTWWEFTQREWRFDILHAAKELDFGVSLNTNWVYSDDSVIEDLASLNLDQITISLDWWEGAHNNIRRAWSENNFESSLMSIKKLSKLWQKTRINTVLNQTNISDVPRLLEFASQYCDEVNFFAMRHIGRASSPAKSKESIDRESFDKISKLIRAMKDEYPSLRTLYWHQVMQDNSINIGNEFNLKYGSPDWLTRFNIIDNGDLYAWGYTPYIAKDPNLFKLGNAVEDNYSLLNVRHNSKRLDWLRENSWVLKDICQSCEYKKNDECPWGIFEMELQKAFGDISSNPYCSKNLDFINKGSLPE